jgi:hypothetical protein
MDDWNGFSVTRLMPFVSQQDLEDTYNLPFKSCVVNGNVASVMCTYDKVNDIPTCVDDSDENLLAGTRKMNLNGYIVFTVAPYSISNSTIEQLLTLSQTVTVTPQVFYKQQHHGATPEDAAADAINRGLDLDCGSFLG